MQTNHMDYRLSATNVRVRLAYHYDVESGEAEWRVLVQNADFFWVLMPDGSLQRRSLDAFETGRLCFGVVEQPTQWQDKQEGTETNVAS